MKYPDKKEMIMDAAIELFKEKGYSNTRIIDIAEKAGIGKGTVYAYFESKEEIMMQIIKNIVQHDFNQYIQELEGDLSLRQNIIGYLELSEKIIGKYGVHAVIFKEMISFDNNTKSEEMLKIIGNMHREQFLKIKSMLDKAVCDGEIIDCNIEQSAILAMTAMGSYMLAKLSSVGQLKVDYPGTELYRKMTKESLADFILYGVCGKGEKTVV